MSFAMPPPNTSPLRLCVMQGDGIGPEITAATLAVLRAAGARWRIAFAFDAVLAPDVLISAISAAV